MNNKKYRINNDMKHCNVQAFSFDHKLTEKELFTLEESIVTVEFIKEIYFKDDIDVQSIEQIKSILENSKSIDESKIEKYILVEYPINILKEILDINYLNPDTWKISYIRVDGAKDIYSITEARKIMEYFNNFISQINNKQLSMLEQICLIYDKVKLLDYQEKKNNLLEIIKNEYANSYGYNMLFQELLNNLSIKSYIEKVKSNEEDRYVTIIDINDNKYKIHGIYLFDPYSDSLPKKEYKEDNIRRINYNYFCMSLKQLNNTIYQESVSGIFKYFQMPKKSMFIDRAEEIKVLDRNKTNKFNHIFGDDHLSLYERINDTKEISETTLFEIINSILRFSNNNAIKNINMIDVIKENYYLRNKEMYH